MVGRIPALQTCGPGSICGKVRGFTLRALCLSCDVSGDGPDIQLTTNSGRPAPVHLSSVQVHSYVLPLKAPDPRALGLYVPRDVSPTLVEVEYQTKKSSYSIPKVIFVNEK